MEKFNPQEYRDDLANDLREIRNDDEESPEVVKADAVDLLKSEKKTDEYKKARDISPEELTKNINKFIKKMDGMGSIEDEEVVYLEKLKSEDISQKSKKLVTERLISAYDRVAEDYDATAKRMKKEMDSDGVSSNSFVQAYSDANKPVQISIMRSNASEMRKRAKLLREGGLEQFQKKEGKEEESVEKKVTKKKIYNHLVVDNDKNERYLEGLLKDKDLLDTESKIYACKKLIECYRRHLFNDTGFYCNLIVELALKSKDETLQKEEIRKFIKEQYKWTYAVEIAKKSNHPDVKSEVFKEVLSHNDRVYSPHDYINPERVVGNWGIGGEKYYKEYLETKGKGFRIGK